MSGQHFESAFFEKASDASQHGVVAAFQKAQELRQIPKETKIDLNAEQVRPAQSAQQYKPRAALSTQNP
jgi:hypothetical protein